MKLIFKIARTELRNLFFSPVAWFITLIFLVICALFYATSIGMIANWQDSLQRTVPSFKQFDMSLTATVFMNMRNGFFSQIFNNLYLFIPLLTMGLINREFNNGTMKLLYSSPVQLSKIVWGKFLAIIAFNLLLTAITIGFLILGAFSIRDADLGHMFAGTIAFFLVICAYTAIGMFMSSITSYQIVSAIATFILLFVLQRVGTLWQEYDFVRDLTYFLSINGRANRMVGGLITTRDIMYYVLISFMFVIFTYLSLRHGRELVSKWTKAGRYLAVFLSVIVLGYLTSRPGYVGYWDGTSNQSNTITKTTQDIISNMQDDPLEITLYTNLLHNSFSLARPSGRNDYIWNFWERYIRFKPDIKFKYVLYYDTPDDDSTIFKRMPGMSLDSIARESARMNETNFDWYMGPEEIRKQIDLAPEEMRAVMQLKYRGKSIFLRTFSDSKFWPFEEHVAAALKRLSSDTVPKIYATTGNLERSMYKRGEREYTQYSIDKSGRGALINHGFEFDTLNLSYQNIPADATALVLADPKVMLNDTVSEKLKNYIDQGGNLLALGEPGKQQVLNPILQMTGAQLMPGTLVQLSKHEMPHMVTPFVTMDHAGLLKKHPGFGISIIEHLHNGDTMKLLHPGAAPISYTGNDFKMRRLLQTLPEVWVKNGPLVVDSAAPVFAPTEGDYRLDSFNVALSLNRQRANRDQKIVVVGDADFLSTARGGVASLGRNYLSWMANESYPVITQSIPAKDILLRISLKAAKIQKLILVWILPAALLIFSTVLLLRRKRQ